MIFKGFPVLNRIGCTRTNFSQSMVHFFPPPSCAHKSAPKNARNRVAGTEFAPSECIGHHIPTPDLTTDKKDDDRFLAQQVGIFTLHNSISLHNNSIRIPRVACFGGCLWWVKLSDTLSGGWRRDEPYFTTDLVSPFSAVAVLQHRRRALFE